MTRDPHSDQADLPDRGGKGDPREAYLWDRRGAADPTVAALERALAAHRWRGRLPEDAAMDAARRRPRRLVRAAAAALAATVLVCAGIAAWRSRAEPEPDGPGSVAGASDAAYRLRVVDGAPRLDGAPADPRAALPLGPGAAVETDAASRARVIVGDVGAIELHPGSRLRVGSAADSPDPAAGYLVHLDRGALTASIFAAPRLFQLGTPSGLAVDLGCVYTASVAADGATHLRVEAGQVSFEAAGRRVLVPTGAATRAWPGVGPGTPVWDDAPEAFAGAVQRLDERVLRDGGEADPVALDELLALARPRDSLSLWHLLAYARGSTAPRVYERLAALAPPPPGVTREACLAGDRDALSAWRDALGWAWPGSTRR